MGNEFIREGRYLILKLKRLPADGLQYLRDCCKPAIVDGMVIESDWPEYEPAWAAIEARVTGIAPQPPALGGEPEVIYMLRNTALSTPWRDADKAAFDCAAGLAEYERRELIDRASLAPYQAEIERLKAQVAELVEAFAESQEMMIERGKRVADLEGLLQMFIENSDDRDVVELSQHAFRPTEGVQS